MELHISKWGNSLAVRLPQALVKQLGVEEGSTLHAEVLGAQLLGVCAPVDAPSRQQLVADLKAMHVGMRMTQPLTADEKSRY